MSEFILSVAAENLRSVMARDFASLDAMAEWLETMRIQESVLAENGSANIRDAALDGQRSAAIALAAIYETKAHAAGFGYADRESINNRLMVHFANLRRNYIGNIATYLAPNMLSAFDKPEPQIIARPQRPAKAAQTPYRLQVTWKDVIVLDARLSAAMARNILVGLAGNFIGEASSDWLAVIPTLDRILTMTPEQRVFGIAGDETGDQFFQLDRIDD